MDTNDKTKCECYCHKKGAHCCDGGSGSCALCGEISDWAIKELVPPPVTASLETGGWEEEFDVKNKEHWGIGSVGAFDIKDFIHKTITHTNASVTEQTARETILELLSLMQAMPINERMGMPRHLVAIDLHKYAKSKGISLSEQPLEKK